ALALAACSRAVTKETQVPDVRTGLDASSWCVATSCAAATAFILAGTASRRIFQYLPQCFHGLRAREDSFHFLLRRAKAHRSSSFVRLGCRVVSAGGTQARQRGASCTAASQPMMRRGAAARRSIG